MDWRSDLTQRSCFIQTSIPSFRIISEGQNHTLIYNIGRDTLSQRNTQHASEVKGAEYSTMSCGALKEVGPV